MTLRGDAVVAERPPAESAGTAGAAVGACDDADAAPSARREAFRAALASEARFASFSRDALPRVYGYLVNRCQGDAALAEDLAQSAFGEGIRQAASFDGRSDPVVWLIGIARHKLVDHLREQEREERRRMRLVVRELTLDCADDPWRGLDERAVLIATLARLCVSQRAVLIRTLQLARMVQGHRACRADRRGSAAGYRHGATVEDACRTFGASITSASRSRTLTW